MVCENVGGSIRKIKREATEEEAAGIPKGVSAVTGMQVDPVNGSRESTLVEPAAEPTPRRRLNPRTLLKQRTLGSITSQG